MSISFSYVQQCGLEFIIRFQNGIGTVFEGAGVQEKYTALPRFGAFPVTYSPVGMTIDDAIRLGEGSPQAVFNILQICAMGQTDGKTYSDRKSVV